jgi:hypothetical protein
MMSGCVLRITKYNLNIKNIDETPTNMSLAMEAGKDSKRMNHRVRP